MAKRLFDFEMRDLQHYIVKKCKEIQKLLVAVDMSMGKTVAVLTFLLDLFKETGRQKRVLVVAPLLVARETWPTEIETWRHLRPLKNEFAVMVGTPEERRRALRKDVFIHIINKENLAWLWEEIGGEAGWIWDVLVIDEASMLKDGKKRTKRSGGGKGSRPLSRFGVIARAAKLCTHIIEMSGTPTPEGIHNLWGLIYILDGGERLGRSKSAFTQRWFDTGFMGYSMDPHPGAVEEIINRSSDIVISLQASDHIKLPPVMTHPETTKWVDFPPKLMREYREFERELYSEKYDVEAVSSGVLTNKLLQFANGSMYRDGGQAVQVHDLKLRALEEMLEELDGQHALIAWSYKFDKEAMKKRFGKKITFLDEAGKNVIKDWNAGKIVNLATHPLSISHGTNLQFGGFNTIWYGLQHSGETYRQFSMRIPRPGQRAPVCYNRHILARGTKDEEVIVSQEYKKATEQILRDAQGIRVTAEDVERELRGERG